MPDNQRTDVYKHSDDKLSAKIGRTSNGSYTFEVSARGNDLTEVTSQLATVMNGVTSIIAEKEAV